MKLTLNDILFAQQDENDDLIQIPSNKWNHVINNIQHPNNKYFTNIDIDVLDVEIPEVLVEATNNNLATYEISPANKAIIGVRTECPRKLIGYNPNQYKDQFAKYISQGIDITDAIANDFIVVENGNIRPEDFNKKYINNFTVRIVPKFSGGDQILNNGKYKLMLLPGSNRYMTTRAAVTDSDDECFTVNVPTYDGLPTISDITYRDIIVQYNTNFDPNSPESETNYKYILPSDLEFYDNGNPQKLISTVEVECPIFDPDTIIQVSNMEAVYDENMGLCVGGEFDYPVKKFLLNNLVLRTVPVQPNQIITTNGIYRLVDDGYDGDIDIEADSRGMKLKKSDRSVNNTFEVNINFEVYKMKIGNNFIANQIEHSGWNFYNSYAEYSNWSVNNEVIVIEKDNSNQEYIIQYFRNIDYNFIIQGNSWVYERNNTGSTDPLCLIDGNSEILYKINIYFKCIIN